MARSVIDRTAVLADRTLPLGAAWRLPLTIGNAFSLTGLVVVATLRARYGTSPRPEYVCRSDGDEITVAGQVITIYADPAAISEAEDSTTTLADVAALGQCAYWVDIWDAEETEVLMRIQGKLDFTTGPDAPETPTASASAVTVGISDETPVTVNVSGTGVDGASAYLYIGYASDDEGTDYSDTPGAGLDHIAFLASSTEIETPTAEDFEGLWVAVAGGSGSMTDAEIRTAYETERSVMSQAEAEAGSATTVRLLNALRIRQAVDARIAALIDSSPSTLDTLNELAAALGDDPNFATTMTTALAGKQPIDATLTAFAALAGSSGKLPYFSGNDTFSLADITAAGRALLDDADATAQIATLGLAALFVALAGDQTIAGVKTFSSSPIVPAPTTDMQAATKKYVDDNAGGGGGSGTVTSVAVSGSDGIEIDSGSPITSSGTIALGINAGTLRTHLNVENGATADQSAAEIRTAYESERSVMSQAEAEAGSETTVRLLNSLRIRQAIDARIAALIDSSPSTLDTLNELAAALGDDPNFATTMTTALAGKQPIDATLTAFAALAGSSGKLPYFSGNDTFSLADITAAGRALLDDADATAQIATLGLAALFVALAGDQTVAGVKTFSSSPIVPAPTTDMQAATKKYVDDNAGGGSSSSGWTLIDEGSATSVSTVIEDGIFTSAYTEYQLILIGAKTDADTSSLRLKLRASGADLTSNYALAGITVNTGGGSPGTRYLIPGNAQPYWTLYGSSGTGTDEHSMCIINLWPQSGLEQRMIYQYNGRDYIPTEIYETGAGWIPGVTSNVDGFKITTAAEGSYTLDITKWRVFGR